MPNWKQWKVSGSMLAIVVLCWAGAACAATNEPTVAEWVKAKMERDRTPRAEREDFSLLLQADPNKAYEALLTYRNHPNHEIRSEMLRYMMMVKAAHSTPDLDRKLVRLLLDYFVEKYDEEGLMRHDAVFYLPRFALTYFGKDEKDLIRKALREKELTKDTLKLYSIAHMKEDLPELKKVFDARKWSPDEPVHPNNPESGRWYLSMKWAFRCLLAELGDDDSVRYCVGQVDEEPRPEIRLHAMLGMARVRHPAVVELMVKYLNRDDRVPSNHGDSFALSGCAVQVLAGMLNDFPVKQKRSYALHSDAEIAQCRKWMAEQTEWKFLEF